MNGTAIVLRFLLRVQRKRLERRITEGFDPDLSRTIDALIAAEEALRG